MTQLRVSIVHWNRPAECLATVASLQEQNLPLAITVVDNHSTDDEFKRLIQGLPGHVEVIRLAANVGWGRAHNIVLRRWLEEESSEFCVVSAHDALPGRACLQRLLTALGEHADWGMACPEYGRSELPTYSVLRGARIQPVPARRPGTREEVPYAHGTLAVLRRECIADIGMYDEGYFAYGDETEIGLRATRRGWKVGLVWGAVVINPGSWSGNAVIGYLWTRSSLRLARTYGGVLGLLLRASYVAAVTCALWLRRAPANSISSPRARWLALRDYWRGCSGDPPGELLSAVAVGPKGPSGDPD
jgi:GT2 family glycosyltransferase